MPPARFALILGLALSCAALSVGLAAWLGPVAGGAGLGLGLLAALVARALIGRGT